MDYINTILKCLMLEHNYKKLNTYNKIINQCPGLNGTLNKNKQETKQERMHLFWLHISNLPRKD